MASQLRAVTQAFAEQMVGREAGTQAFGGSSHGGGAAAASSRWPASRTTDTASRLAHLAPTRPMPRLKGGRSVAGEPGGVRPLLTGSHRDERPSGIPDGHEQRAGTRPRSRTDLNGSGYPHMELRIRRLGVRVPPSAPMYPQVKASLPGIVKSLAFRPSACRLTISHSPKRSCESWRVRPGRVAVRHRSRGRRSSG